MEACSHVYLEVAIWMCLTLTPFERGDREIDLIDENLQTFAELHKHTERDISPPQLLIEKVTDFLGQPRSTQIPIHNSRF